MPVTLRPLSLGELLDRTFQIYRQHFVTFVGIAAVPALVLLAFNVAFALPSADRSPIASIISALALIAVNLAAAAITQAGTVIAVSELYLERPIGIGGALSAARARMVAIIVAMLVVGLGIFLGFLLLIVPGVLLALRWALVIPVVVIEEVPVRNATSRSTTLTEGHRLRALLLYCLYFVISMIATVLLQMPVAMAAAMMGDDAAETARLLYVMSFVGTFLTQALVTPLATIGFSLMYYDERVRKEAFDLEHMMSRIDEGQVTPATS